MKILFDVYERMKSQNFDFLVLKHETMVITL